MESNIIGIADFINKYKTKESFIKQPRAVGINPDYQHWRANARASIAEYLLHFIIRGTSNNDINNKIFNAFYSDKKLLVTRFEDDELARRLNYRNSKSIVKYLKKLEEENIFKIHYMPWNRNKIKIYELGYWSLNNYGEHKEVLYVYQKFFMDSQLNVLSNLGVEN